MLAGETGLAGVTLRDPIVDGDTFRGCLVAQVSADRPVGPVAHLLAALATQPLLRLRSIGHAAHVAEMEGADRLRAAPVDRRAADLVLQVAPPPLLSRQEPSFGAVQSLHPA